MSRSNEWSKRAISYHRPMKSLSEKSLVGVLSTAAERAPTVHAVTMTDKIASVSKVTIFFKVFPIRFNP